MQPSPPSRLKAPFVEALPSGAHNFPAATTRLIGRERERAEVGRLLRATRLVTLTGGGGIGKSRLGREAALQRLPYLGRDGAWLLELAALGDPALLPQAVAVRLGVWEGAEREAAAAVTEFLKPRQALLVLDNCEHLVSACAGLAQTLLDACPGLSNHRDEPGGPWRPWRVCVSGPCALPACRDGGGGSR